MGTSVSDGKPRTFVLVHGAWHGGWCWRRLAAVLRGRGNTVFAPSHLRRTYVASTKPQYELLVPTHHRIRGDRTWSYTTLEEGHDSTVTAPAALGSLLTGL